MKAADKLEIFSQVINFSIFLYFAVILIKTNPLNIKDIVISAIGLFGSLVINIVKASEILSNR